MRFELKVPNFPRFIVLRGDQLLAGQCSACRAHSNHYATYVFGVISRTFKRPEGSRSATCVLGAMQEGIAQLWSTLALAGTEPCASSLVRTRAV